MILDDLKASTLKRVEREKSIVSPEELRRRLKDRPAGRVRKRFDFEKALSGPGMHYICEVKKASPSKGIIAEDFPYTEIAKEYDEAGADAISVLTEPEYFKGELRYIEEIRELVDTPILRKDFTCDGYMIDQAAYAGADCILLIAALLTAAEMTGFRERADELGLSAIFEAHDEKEITRCLDCGARILGVNNRNLKNFDVDITNSGRLRKMVPADVIFVAESGIKTASDVQALKQIGVNACLIGETLMRSPDKKVKLKELDGVEGTVHS